MADRHDLVDRWVADYADRVFRLAYALLGNKTAAEDAAQESLLHIARWCLSHDGFTPTQAWVYQVTRNVVRDLGRRREILTVPLTDERTSDGDELIITRLDVAHTLKALPQHAREVLVLYYFLDLSSREVARILGISHTAARIRLSRARTAFRNRYEACLEVGKGESHEP